jgi:hypothetical protein
MFLSGLFSLKSIVSLSILVVAVGIGSFLYLTLDEDFEAQRRMLSRTTGSESFKSPISFDDITQIVNTARQAWSIVDKKYKFN